MINKRYLKYTLLLFTFGMTACSDFLDEVNHSSQSIRTVRRIPQIQLPKNMKFHKQTP